MSKRKIAAGLGIGATAAGECLRRAREAGVGWPLPDDMTDAGLEARLYPASTVLAEIKARRPQPDWPTLHRELKRKGVTLQLVWEEHRAEHPDGYGYSRFCELYRAWEGRLSPTMRQTHVAGERAVRRLRRHDDGCDRRRDRRGAQAQLFVAVHGASSYTWAEATWTQTLPDWIGSHTRAFAFFGGVAAMVVSDYVSGHIIRLMCRSRLCGRRPGWPAIAGVRPGFRPHNVQSAASQFNSAASSRHTGLRGNAAEAATGGAHASSAASFERMLISA